MALYPFVVNGVTYNLSDFSPLGYVTNRPASMKDVARHALIQSGGSSATSLTIGTGSKVLTTQAGLSYQPGDTVFIVAAASPTTNRMFGQVTAYNFSTGSLTVNIIGVIGSGTLASWLIGLGGQWSSQNASYLLALDSGGMGNGKSTFVQYGGFIGLNEPDMAMREIFEDFAGSQSGVATVKAPWYASNLDPTVNVGAGPATMQAIAAAGYFQLGCKPNVSPNRQSAILSYNRFGFMHFGMGAAVWESNVYAVGGGTNYDFRAGVMCQGSGYTYNIFSGGGIGFEARSDTNNGRYVLVAGLNGYCSRVNTNVLPSATGDKLRFEVDMDGYRIDFFINNSYVGSITGWTPTTGGQNLCKPAYEVGAYFPSAGTAYWATVYIDSCYLRKFVLR